MNDINYGLFGHWPPVVFVLILLVLIGASCASSVASPGCTNVVYGQGNIPYSLNVCDVVTGAGAECVVAVRGSSVSLVCKGFGR